jgi:hypothetical protein
MAHTPYLSEGLLASLTVKFSAELQTVSNTGILPSLSAWLNV